MKSKAFVDLMQGKDGRNSENANGKQILYEELIMAGYLSSTEEDIQVIY